MARRTHPPLTPEQFEEISQRFRLLGDPLRLRLLNELRAGERSVGELALAVDASQPNVSKHLGLLHRAGLLARRQDGNSVYYEVADPTIFDLCEIVCGSIERDLERRRRRFAV